MKIEDAYYVSWVVRIYTEHQGVILLPMADPMENMASQLLVFPKPDPDYGPSDPSWIRFKQFFPVDL